MFLQWLVLLALLFGLSGAATISPHSDMPSDRQRRSLDISNWQSADDLFKQLYAGKNHPFDEDPRIRRSGTSLELRPVEGPINIEQLPAMLASRYVKRYPYSQIDDPAVIGR